MGEALDIRGVGTAIVTPFKNEQVDYDALAHLLERQIEGGANFLVPCGTTGESPTLTDEERLRVIEKTVEVANSRVPVVAGTGTNDTPHSVAMTRAAWRLGADACLAVTPYYNKPTQEGLYRHFRAMIDDGGLPAVLYHIPSRCGISIEIDTVKRVAEAGGVVGLKETGGVERVTDLRLATDVPILSGDDGLTLPMMALGGVGVISVASNVVPEAIRRMVDAAAASDFVTARAEHEKLTPLFDALFLESNPIPVKAAVVLTGHLENADVRLPLVEVQPATVEALKQALQPFLASATA